MLKVAVLSFFLSVSLFGVGASALVADNMDSSGGMSPRMKILFEIRGLKDSLNELYENSNGVVKGGRLSYLSKRLYQKNLEFEQLDLSERLQLIDLQISNRQGGKYGMDELHKERDAILSRQLEVERELQNLKAISH